ncbi:MAG: 8-amino-7-oxononanoate synthase, partial [Pedobacter sp.]
MSFSIFTDASALPARWDLIAEPNVLLSRQYLAVLQNAAPANMDCHFIGLYKNNNLCGIAIAQYINLSNINIFGEKKKSFSIKDYLVKRFSSHILVVGNNTITGQNAFLFSNDITQNEALDLLQDSIKSLKNQYRKRCINIDLVVIKDFDKQYLSGIKESSVTGFHDFSTQPNMIFSVKENWKNMANYIDELNTKYRTQYNRARKKAEGIEKRLLSASEIKLYNQRINELYLTVAKNASFNTFYLPENHFEVFKQQLGEDFLFNGYFIDDQLVGFSTLIKNEQKFEAYFLGYDAAVQKEKMLYLNILYDFIES